MQARRDAPVTSLNLRNLALTQTGSNSGAVGYRCLLAVIWRANEKLVWRHRVIHDRPNAFRGPGCLPQPLDSHHRY